MDNKINDTAYIELDGVFGRIFNIHNKDYYQEHEKLYKHNKIFLAENSVSCFVGCNGIGKSTIIRQMIFDNENCLNNTAYDLNDTYSLSFKRLFDEDYLRENYTEFYLNGNKKSSFGYTEDDFMKNDLSKLWCSTGEANMATMGPIFRILGKETNLLANKRLFIFLDDLDVGVSVDELKNVVSTIKLVEKKLIEKNIKFYIVLAANSYELARYFNCIDTVSFKPVKFKNYESYVKYVCKTRDYKDKRIERMVKYID